jgi:hypothetical protein
MIDLHEIFKKFNIEHLAFERVENPPSSRCDLCAFLLLDKLLPGAGKRIIGSAERDQIFLSIDCKALAEVASENDILTLVRCGVFYDRSVDSLTMFV